MVRIVTGTMISVTSASPQMVNIITSTPTSWRLEDSSWLSVCCMLWARLSMSLVTRLSRSPRGWRSTWLSGIRLSFVSTSARSRNIERCTTPASSQPWA